jgi:beta-lactamase class A
VAIWNVAVCLIPGNIELEYMPYPLLPSILLVLTLFQVSSSLTSQFAQISRKAEGRVGVAVSLIESGESHGLRSVEKFPMQSVFKLPIAMAVLRKIDQGEFSLDQKILIKKSDLAMPGHASVIRDQHPEGNFEMSVRELLRTMMDVSDGTACDMLLRLAGGSKAVTEYIHSLGVHDMAIAFSQKEMSGQPKKQDQNWTTPGAALQLLRALVAGPALSAGNRELLVQFMAESRTGPKRIKGLLPAGTKVSHKTGSSSTVNGWTHATNDIGIVELPEGRHLAVAVFVADSRAGEAMRDQVIAEIARAAWDYFCSARQRPPIVTGNAAVPINQ